MSCKPECARRTYVRPLPPATPASSVQCLVAARRDFYSRRHIRHWSSRGTLGWSSTRLFATSRHDQVVEERPPRYHRDRVGNPAPRAHSCVWGATARCWRGDAVPRRGTDNQRPPPCARRSHDAPVHAALAMSESGVVREEACSLVRRAITPSDRILVTGASGWFGTTMLALLAGHPSTGVLAVASRSRAVAVAGRTWDVTSWDEQAVADFDPTVVLNFAFLTRDKEAELGPDEYMRANIELSRRFDTAASLPSVRAAVTCSSGAALLTPEGVDVPIGSYGQVKADEEFRAQALATSVRAVVVARAWSLSGTLVQRPGDYAFSDLVLQAGTGRIVVTADYEVWRRYCGVDDYLAVCVARAAGGWSGVIDSGGEEVELRDLAERIAGRFPGRQPQVISSPAVGDSRRYLSDDTTWQQACLALGYRPASLDEQVNDVRAGLT